MRRACLPLVMLTAHSLAEPLEVALEVDPSSQSTLTVAIGSGQAVGTMTHWGTLNARIDLDPITAEPQTVSFSGGSLHYSDGESVFESDEDGIERLYLTRTGMSASPDTLVEAGSIDSVTGALDNLEHLLRLNTGTLEILYGYAYSGGVLLPLSHTIDYGENPEAAGFTGTTRLLSAVNGAGSLREHLEFTLIHETSSEPVVEELEGGVTVTSWGSGGFTALGSIEAPSAGLRQWLVAAGAEVDFSDPDAGAVPYAMGLASPKDPIPVVIEPGSVRLTLPAVGTRARLRAWHSASLQGWQGLPWPGGGLELPVGASGEIEIVLPPGNRGFVRFEALNE